MNQTLGCAVDVKQPQVSGAVMALQDQIETLENRFAALASRLDPVLRPANPKDCTSGDKPILVPLADQIGRAVRRLSEVDNFLFDLIDRLEV